jgi:hypothetical protein
MAGQDSAFLSQVGSQIKEEVYRWVGGVDLI